MGLTYFASNKILDELNGRTNGVTFGPDIYVGLSTTEPTAAGANVTEPSGNGYARVLLGYYGQSASYKMGAASNGAAENTAIIFFPEATGAWGTCTHFLIYDAQSGGNLLAFGALTSSISPVANDVPIVRVGNLDISIA